MAQDDKLARGMGLGGNVNRLTGVWMRLYGCASRLVTSYSMTEIEKLRAVLCDSHFLIPLIVFGIGLALLITLH